MGRPAHPVHPGLSWADRGVLAGVERSAALERPGLCNEAGAAVASRTFPNLVRAGGDRAILSAAPFGLLARAPAVGAGHPGLSPCDDDVARGLLCPLRPGPRKARPPARGPRPFRIPPKGRWSGRGTLRLPSGVRRVGRVDLGTEEHTLTRLFP